MHKNYLDYYTSHEEKIFPDKKQLITYSFNEVDERSLGLWKKKRTLSICMSTGEKYIGFEFFISFSKKPISYTLIQVKDMIP